MKHIRAKDIERYRKEHGVSVIEAKRALEAALKDDYIKELEDLVSEMYEGFVLGYIDNLEQEDQMQIIDSIIERIREYGIKTREDDLDLVSRIDDYDWSNVPQDPGGYGMILTGIDGDLEGFDTGEDWIF